MTPETAKSAAATTLYAIHSLGRNRRIVTPFVAACPDKTRHDAMLATSEGGERAWEC